MTVYNGDILGGTLNLANHDVANLSQTVLPGDNATFNVSGSATLNLRTSAYSFYDPPHDVVNIAPHGDLFGTFNLDGQTYLTIQGGADTEYHVTTENILRGTAMTVDTAVVGHGSFIVGDSTGIGGRQHNSGLEFGGAVAKGITVEVSGMLGARSAESVVTIDRPGEFKGNVLLHQDAELELAGLAKQAASWSYRGDTLNIFDAKGHVIDSLEIAEDKNPGGGFKVILPADHVLITAGSDTHGTL